MSTLNRYNNGWGNVPDGIKLQRYNNGWDAATKAQVRNGSWQTIWNKSDEITRSFYATFSTAMRWSAGGFATYDPAGTASNDAEADLFIGYFGGSNPYHYTSVMTFGNDIDYGQSIASYLATRPNVTGASLRLMRYSSGTTTLGTSYCWTGNWTQPSFSSLPTPDLDGSEHDWSNKAQTTITGWSHGSQQTINVANQAVKDMVNNGYGLMLAGTQQQTGYTTANVDGTSTTTNYSRIYGVATAGATDSRKIMLTVKFDY